MITYYHFAPGDARLSHFDDRPIKKGSKFSLDIRAVPVFGEKGFHAVTSILLGISCGYGSLLSEVRVSGRTHVIKTPQGEMVCARTREHIEVVDFRRPLVQFCFFCVREYVATSKIKLPKKVTDYLGDPTGKSIKILGSVKNPEIDSIIERLVMAFLDYKYSSLVIHHANMMWCLVRGSVDWFKAENFLVDKYKETRDEAKGQGKEIEDESKS